MRKFHLLLIMALLTMMLVIGCDAEGNSSSDSSESSEPSTPPAPAPIHYSIRFDKNGGTGTMNDLSAVVGQEITLPVCSFTAPTGKKFGTWNTEANGNGTSYGVGATVKDLTTDDGAIVTLYAQWIEKDAHIISYLNTKNVDNSLNPDSFLESATVSLNEITAIGYTFDGWYEVTNDTTSDTSTDGWAAGAKTADVTLWAKWTAHTYTIKFNSNGGTGSMDDLSMTYDVSADLPVNTFTRGNYVFKGWATSADGEVVYNDEQNVKDLTADNGAEVTLYAVWSDTFVLANGNMQINGVEYSNTSFVKVIDTEVTVDGTDDNWSSYLDSSAEDKYKGAFLNGRNVKLSPYSMGQYLVTQELYEAVMNSGKNYDYNSTDEGEHPAYYVSWYDAITFCNKLSLLMGKEPCYTVSGITDWVALAYSSIPTSTDSTWNAAVCDITKNGYRLPTEAEWEFAARGGDQTADDWKYAFSGIQSLKKVYRGTTDSDTDYVGTSKNLQKDDNLATVGWYGKNNSSKVHSVSGKTANRLGIYDMSGNLWEWCWDWYNTTVTTNDAVYKDGEGVVINPLGPDSGSYRVQRGGCWNFNAYYCCVSYRGSNDPYYRSSSFGFRLACSAE